MSAEATLDALPRLRLCQLPTPVQRLERVESALGLTDGPELWIKRDDLTGLGLGGNKGRKLEFALAEAQQEGANAVLTTGGVQSNHCRQTAIAGAGLGLEPHLFLKGRRPSQMTGNLLPSELCGAVFHFVGPKGAYTEEPSMTEFADRLRAEGRTPYVIPGGASNVVGAMGYVAAAREIRAQEEELGRAFDHIFHATGSTGTQAGLLAGAKLFGLNARITGVAVGTVADPETRRRDIAEFVAKILDRLGASETVPVEDVRLLTEYVGEGYAVPTPAGRAAVRLLAERAGIFLDYTYTGKAMAGLLDRLRQGAFRPEDRVLFIHTGGHIALFA
jgi:D-cysteine desulfhydrase family pyridoxal phosphate-dependent enzyme